MKQQTLKHFKKLSSPKIFFQTSELLKPWIFFFAMASLSYGLIAGLLFAPADYQQGEAFRIIYIHVPCALYSLGLYVALSLAALVFLIWHIKVADVLAYACASIGAWITFLALTTGAIWGQPMWGTWWIWDARLTSELILLFLYLSVIILRHALPDAKAGAKASAIFAIVGAIDVPIIHYSVTWWHTLHQGSSITLTKSTIATPMLYPLLAMIVGSGLLLIWLVLNTANYELLAREISTQWVQGMLND